MPLTPYADSPRQTDQIEMVNIPEIDLSSQMIPIQKEKSQERLTEFLADNQTAELIWNYPYIPRPLDPRSIYRRVGCIADGNCLFHSILKSLSPLYVQSYKVGSRVDEKTLQTFEKAVNNRIIFDDSLFDRVRSRIDLTTTYQIYNQKKYSHILSKFRTELAIEIRSDLANKIQSDPDVMKIIQKYLSGAIELIAEKINSDFSGAFEIYQKQLISELLSNQAVSPEFLIILSEYLGFDFYLLRDVDLIRGNSKISPLYGGSSLHFRNLGPQDLRSENNPRKSYPNRNSVVIISYGDMHYELIGRIDMLDDRKELLLVFNQAEPLIRTLYVILTKLLN